MAKIIEKLSYYMDIVYKTLGVTFLVLLFVSSLVQVFARYILNNSPSWTEELARYAFIWTSLLGTAVASRYKSHITVDLWVGAGKKTKYYRDVVLDILMLLVGAMLTFFGVQMMGIGRMMKSAAMQLPMSFMYLSVVVCGVGIMIQVLNCLLGDICTYRKEKGGEGA